MTGVVERVAKGAQFLDQADPDWWRADVERAIDLDALNLTDGEKCVLGQRCPLEARTCPFYVFAGQLSGIELDYDGQDWEEQDRAELLVDDWAAPLGFQASGPLTERGNDFDDLTAEWKRVITGRRAAS